MSNSIIWPKFGRPVILGANGKSSYGKQITSVSEHIYFQDDFESGNLSSPTIADPGWSWGLSNSDHPTLSLAPVTTIAKNGSYSLRFPFKSGADLDDAWEEQRFNVGGSLTEVYVRFWLYVPPNYRHRNTASSDNNKFFRIWCTDYNYTKLGCSLQYRDAADPAAGSSLTWERINSTDPAGVVTSCVDDMIIPADFGSWVRYQMFYKLDTVGDNARFKIWKNGVLKYDSGDFDNPPISGANVFTEGYILGYSNSGFDEETLMYVDDVTFSDSPEDAVTDDHIPAEAPAWVASGNLQTEYAFDEAEGANPTVAGWQSWGVGPNGWNVATAPGGTYSQRNQVADDGAPRSPGEISRVWYLTGMHDDYDLSACSIAYNPDSFYTTVPVYEKVFQTIWFRYSNNFLWQTSMDGAKFCFCPANYGNSTGNWVVMAIKESSTTYSLGIVDNALGQFGTDALGVRNRATKVIVNLGDWVRLSMEFRASHYNTADGSVNLWVNGTNQGEISYGAVKHSSDAGVAKANIHGFYLGGYLGGAASITIPTNQYLDFDHVSMWSSD